VTFFDKRSPAEYANIEMIRMLHSFQYLNYCEAGGYSQFYRFLRLCSSKKLFVFQMVNLLKRSRGLLNEEKVLFGISAFGVFRMILFTVL